MVARALFACLLLVVALCLASRLVANTLCCADDAFMAVAAKNLATGVGYASSYPTHMVRPREVVAFDPIITTGPTLILPAAAAIAVFGNEYWVPGAALAIVVGLCWIALFASWRRLFGSEERALAAGAGALVLALAAMVDHEEHWTALLGEIPAALLAALSMTLLAVPRLTPGRAFAAGACFGLALLAKITALPALPALGAAFALASTRGVGSWRRAVVALGLGLATPLAAFEFWKLLSVGAGGYLPLKAAELDAMAAHPARNAVSASGLVLRDVVARNLSALDAFLGIPMGGVALFALAALALLAARGREGVNRLGVALILAFSIHALWWMLLSNRHWMRHALPGFLYLAIGLAVVCSTPGRRRLRLAVGALALAVFAPRLAAIPRAYGSNLDFRRSPRTEAMLATRDFLEVHPDPLVADWWGTAVDLEYLLAGASNFVPSWLVDEDRRDAAWVVRNERFLDRRFNKQSRQRMDDWIAACGGRRIFARGPYSVHACRAAPDPSAPELAVTPAPLHSPGE